VAEASVTPAAAFRTGQSASSFPRSITPATLTARRGVEE
jgi:hypothetical protein